MNEILWPSDEPEPHGCILMPCEFLQGRSLSSEELELIRQQIEGFDGIEALDPEIRDIVERNWPHLLAKLPPDE